MPIKLSKNNQSLFDVAAENFGTLDNLIKLSSDNGIGLSDNLKTGTELIVNNSNLGEADVKKTISDNELTFNNDYIPLVLFTVDTTLITADSTLITADTR